MKLGAVDYLQKALRQSGRRRSRPAVSASLERKEAGGDASPGAHPGSSLVAVSPAMNGILQTLRKVVDSDAKSSDN